MANTFYTAEQVAKVAVAMATQDSYLGALVNRNFENDLLGGGGKGRTVNVRIPSALIARSRGIDDISTNIVLDSLTETTVPITLGEHLYNAVALSEGDLTLNLEDFSKQVLAPQVDAVVDSVEEEVAAALRAVTLDTSIAWDEANPVKTFTAIRKVLRDRGVPQTGLNVVVGTNVYAALLDAKAITDASESGSTAALRDGNVGNVRGFKIVESTRVDEDEIMAFHRDAFTLAVRAPIVPAGASFGQSISGGGYSLRYLRDYDVMKTVDRSMVSTFAGVAAMPLYKVTRDHTAKTAVVEEVAGGAALRMSISDTEPA
ncbi:major capsid protein [Arthrobacter phage Wildwest]|uniref:Major capsid protein n=1 Tax=Arthrobacter phage Wildwest TaxID=3051767 RepID=A0AA96KIH0_9CAUD|nr:major capsid protein [Arthrobacter phage Wildwest]